jgi:hypothetical protein
MRHPATATLKGEKRNDMVRLLGAFFPKGWGLLLLAALDWPGAAEFHRANFILRVKLS